MAKLPGINYSAPVPSMGRQDPMQPVRVANAQARAAAAVGGAIGDMADVFADIQREEGRNAAAEASSDFLKAEAAIKTDPNIAGRQERMEALRESMSSRTDGMNKRAAEEFRNSFDEWSLGRVDKVIIDGVAENHATQRATTETTALELASQGEVGEATAFIDGSGLFSDEEKVELKKNARLSGELGNIDRTIAERNPEAISRLLSEYDDKDYSGELPPSQRRAAVVQLNAAFELSVAEFDAGQAKITQLEASNLEIAVRNGLSGPAQIHQAWEDDTITGPKRTQLMVIWQNAVDAAVKQSNDIELVDTSIVNGTPLDRTNTDHTDAVDAWYDDIILRYQDDPQLTMEHGVNVASHTNILPEQLEADIRRMAYAGSNDNVMVTANIYEALERDAPQTIADIGAREIAVYKQAMAFHRGGANLEDSVKRARENAYKPANEIALLNQRYSIEVAPDITTAHDHLQSWMNGEDQFDVSFGPFGAPKVSNAQFAAYRSSEMAYYQYTNGDVELARSMARDDFKRVFTTSKINNRSEIMAYSPEREYGMELGAEPLRQDLDAFYVEESLIGDSAFILSDGVTARDPVGGRSYAVYTLDDMGLPSKHTRRWKPNAERMKAEHITRVKKAVESSKAKDKIAEGRFKVGAYPTYD